MDSCLTKAFAEWRRDARGILIDTVRADYRPDLVRVNEDRIRELDIPQEDFEPMSTGLVGTPPGEHLLTGIAYLLVLNSQNFQFWDVSSGKYERYEFEGVTGAMGMRRALAKVWGDDPTPATFRRVWEEKGVRGIFGPISQPLKRDRMLDEVLSGPLESMSRTIAMFAQGHGKRFGVEHAKLIADEFPIAYADPYLKRAQLALLEIASFCAEFDIPVKVDSLTLCADYQLPRVMRALGVLEYADGLALRVDNRVLIPQDSAEERAIRAATIVAGELMAAHFDVPAAAVDNYLWQRRNEAGETPFHLTVTTAY